MTDNKNPLQLQGIEFIHLTTTDTLPDMTPNPQGPAYVDKTLKALGCSKLMKHAEQARYYYRQNDIHVVLDHGETGFERAFAEQHGASLCAMGWRVANAEAAYKEALKRGARAFEPGLYGNHGWDMPCIFGIGDSLIYFVDDYTDKAYLSRNGYKPLDNPELIEEKGFLRVDHLTNNVYKNTMAYWADFYKNIFGFTEIRYFDIKGSKTGLTSFALQSPCGTFSIPINEGNESKSQIEEYLRQYHGTGVQHIALATQNLLTSLDKMEAAGSNISMLDIDADYYEEAFARVPNVREDKTHIQKHQVLLDGDENGYLLQIFTKNLFGPIFFELIQRENNDSFGEGNFTALFKSIERDQERRGVL